MSRKSAPIRVVVHYPQTEEGKQKLAELVAKAHADMINQYIRKLDCPSKQKVKLLDAIIKSAHEEKSGK